MRTFARDRSGGAAVEFGLVAPLLIAVVLGISASSEAIYQHHVMRKAVSAGAQLIMTTDADMEAVRDLTLEAWNGKADGSSVQVSQWCRCGSAQHSCSTICTDGDYPETFTRIDAATPYTGPLGDQTLTSSQLVRTR
ncbi:MAG: pilus assembly protein [Caulobacter sp.]|nr:pilus assembly protein [Caulobacter sp.]